MMVVFPQVSLISGSKTGFLHPRNYLRKTLLIKYLWAGRRVMSPGGEGRGRTPAVTAWLVQNLHEGETPWRVTSPVDPGTKIRKSSNIYQVPAIPSLGH